MNDLVEKMLDAYWQDCRPCSSCKAGQQTGMTAAAKVLLEAALGPLTPEERGIAGADYCTRPDCLPDDYNNVLQFCLKNFIASRKARLLAPKTIESRVTVRACCHGSEVCLDGDRLHWFIAKADAETFRRGLIAEMKEEPHNGSE